MNICFFFFFRTKENIKSGGSWWSSTFFTIRDMYNVYSYLSLWSIPYTPTDGSIAAVPMTMTWPHIDQLCLG